MKEEWKSIIFKGINYTGLYEVSNFGRVKSLEREVRRGNHMLKIKEKILKPALAGNQYLAVSLSFNCKVGHYLIHHLVANAFIGKKPYRFVVDHKDNNQFNNHTDNLQYITYRLNSSKDQKNRSSKYTGVSWNKRSNKWTAYIIINGKKKHLGYFTNELDASDAYQNVLDEIKHKEWVQRAVKVGK